jgi:outer membrane immunogenic protein
VLFAVANSFGSAADAADVRWTGVYAGGNLGYGNADATADYALLGLPLISGSEQLSGAVYGAQLGYNYQLGRVVLGIETDIDATSQKATKTRLCATLVCGLSLTQSSEDSIPWLGTLRLRAGFAFDRFLIYATGGAGYGSFKSTQTLTSLLGTVTTTTSDQHAAWVAGAGVEAALSQHWSVRAEYLYFDTGHINTTYSVAGIGLITEQSRLTESMMRLGVNYRF